MTNYPVKFCIKCNQAWETYTDGNSNQEKYQKVIHYKYMKNLRFDKIICPKCKRSQGSEQVKSKSSNNNSNS